MATQQGIGDVRLNNKGYRIDLATWREKDIIDFAPRATVPGGSVVMSDLNLYQPLNQTDFRHGQGFNWYEDASGYMTTVGNIDTRQDGLAMLMTQKTSSDTNNNRKDGLTVFNGDVFAWGVEGLRKYHLGSWTNVYNAAAVNFALSAGDYLFFCPDGLRIQKMDSAGTISNAGLDSSSTDYKWLIIYNGFIYAGKDGTNQVHYDGNADLSQLEGTTADTNIIYCGIGNMATIGAYVYAGTLYVTRPDGAWTIGEDHIVRRVLDYSSEASSLNFAGISSINGYMMFAMRDQVIQWNGARISYITPAKINDIYPYVMYGQFRHFVQINNMLYMIARTTDTVYTESLLCYDGVGWHKMMDLVTNGTDSISAMNYDASNNYLWIHLDSTNDVTYYIQFQDRSSFPYANFPTTGTHSLVSSRLDMGFRMVKKSMAGIIVEARNCSATCYMSLYYQLDSDGAWIKWTDIKQNGVLELTNPAGFKTREFFWVNLRFDFVTTGSDNSPVLEGYTLRFIMRPNTLLGFNFWIIAADNYQYGSQDDERLAASIKAELLVDRNSKPPIELVAPDGTRYWGYLTSFQGQIMYRVPMDSEDTDKFEYRLQVNFVCVDSGSVPGAS